MAVVGTAWKTVTKGLPRSRLGRSRLARSPALTMRTTATRGHRIVRKINRRQRLPIARPVYHVFQLPD